MNISKNSQLALRFFDESTKINFLRLFMSIKQNEASTAKKELDFLQSSLGELEKIKITDDNAAELLKEYEKNYRIVAPDEIKSREVIRKIDALVNKEIGTVINFLQSIINEDKTTKHFLICESVYYAASLIRIGENFSSRAVKTIKNGHYNYLMGKNKMLRFVVVPGALKGFYYDDKLNITFEFGLDLETGEYYAPKENMNTFSVIMQVLTFVELGDIEVIELLAGRNNGKTKADGKITNTTKNNVYVVDSSWNKLIIRTEGFAVRGHFRLQPCGHEMLDRKLIWINAFEKHGYIRRPKAQIIHTEK